MLAVAVRARLPERRGCRRPSRCAGAHLGSVAGGIGDACGCCVVRRDGGRAAGLLRCVPVCRRDCWLGGNSKGRSGGARRRRGVLSTHRPGHDGVHRQSAHGRMLRRGDSARRGAAAHRAAPGHAQGSVPDARGRGRSPPQCAPPPAPPFPSVSRARASARTKLQLVRTALARRATARWAS